MAFFGQILAIFNQISAKFFCKNVIFEVALTGTNSDTVKSLLRAAALINFDTF